MARRDRHLASNQDYVGSNPTGETKNITQPCLLAGFLLLDLYTNYTDDTLMADFEAKVYKLTIEEHPKADLLEIARVGDYRSIVGKGEYKTGDLGVYIPEQAICPAWLVERLGLVGKLAGKAKNRVKAIKLRGILSQGLIYPVISESDLWNQRVQLEVGQIGVEEGEDIARFLGITKYEPVVPTSMSGEVEGASGCTIKYDIENIKKYPDVLISGEEVYITEKLHGTWCCFGSHPDAPYVVSSKGLSARGLIFQINTENTERNLYVRTLEETRIDSYNLVDRAHFYFNMLTGNPMLPFYILGEIFGRGVQDLHYGLNKPSFRIFDVYVGQPGQGKYLDHEELIDFIYGVEGAVLVPQIYVGKYSKEIVEQYTDGTDMLGGFNVREGVVVKPTKEREHEELGRVILKSVSEDYLLRKGNTTEYN